jgi:hypothetical protein
MKNEGRIEENGGYGTVAEMFDEAAGEITGSKYVTKK